MELKEVLKALDVAYKNQDDYIRKVNRFFSNADYWIVVIICSILIFVGIIVKS